MDEAQHFQPPPQQHQQQQILIDNPKPEPVRSAPNSACVSCRKLKMKCERTGDLGAPCTRCAKSGRVCEDAVPTPRQRRRVVDSPSRFQHVGAPTSVAQLPLPGTYISSPNQYASPYPRQLAATAQMTAAAGPPVANLHRQSYGLGMPVDEDVASATFLSREDTIQFIEIFRDRLLPNLPVLPASDFKDISTTINRYPALTSAICYVTARYVPGLEDIRKSLTPVVYQMFETAFMDQNRDEKTDLSIMQAFMVLYAFTRSSVLEKVMSNDADINFWLIKSSTESYASFINLHGAAEAVYRQVRDNQRADLSDTSTRKYLYWLWIHNMSYQIALATSTPPTMTLDVFVRAAPELLKDQLHDTSVLSIVRGVELCLVWEKLGSVDQSLKEWWRSRAIHELVSGRYHRTTRDDIENVLEESRARYGGTSDDGTVQSLLMNFNHDYARFCLLTQILNLGGELQAEDLQVLDICIHAAVRVLDFPSNIGVARRDQLRYSPSLFFVQLCHCSSFIQSALQNYGGMLQDSTAPQTALKRTTSLLDDLGVSSNQGLAAAARMFELNTLI